MLILTSCPWSVTSNQVTLFGKTCWWNNCVDEINNWGTLTETDFLTETKQMIKIFRTADWNNWMNSHIGKEEGTGKCARKQLAKCQTRRSNFSHLQPWINSYFQPAACFNPYPCSSAQGPVFAPSPLSCAAVRTRRSLGLTSPLLFSECLFIWLLPAQANKVNGYTTVQTALGHKPKEKTKLKKKDHLKTHSTLILQSLKPLFIWLEINIFIYKV